MTFTKSAGEGAITSFPGPEIAALQKRRLILISEIVLPADQINRIDNRLTYLRCYGEMGRCGTASETESEASTEGGKKAGAAEAWRE